MSAQLKDGQGLAALMSDSMGWFSPTDVKRAVLVFDRILYVIPETAVPFEGRDGETSLVTFPDSLRSHEWLEVVHYTPDPSVVDQIIRAARWDAEDDQFGDLVRGIPERERLYTWAVSNTDGDLGRGDSLGLAPDEEALGHALQLNKFMLAAESFGCVPITGKPYIHDLIRAKHQRVTSACSDVAARSGVEVPPTIRAHIQPTAVELSKYFIPDADLQLHTEDEILAYKRENRAIFNEFTRELLSFSASLGALPNTEDFARELRERADRDLLRLQTTIREEVRDAWSKFFRTSLAVGASGAIGVGVAPTMSLGTLVTAGAAAALSLLGPDFLEAMAQRRKARAHGLYYLLAFR